MLITKLGHCCLLIEIKGVRFLTDPGNYTTTQDTVKNIDYVVISHEHSDHLHIESVKKILSNNKKAKIISNSSVGKILEKENISYLEISDKKSEVFNGVTISGHGLDHANIYEKYELVENTGYMFDNILFYPGDSFYDPGIPIKILAFPVSGPWCKISEAINYVTKIKPEVAFAVHDGNITRPQGITKRLPALTLPKYGINFLYLEIGKEYEL